jgi:hypothetical protein
MSFENNSVEIKYYMIHCDTHIDRLDHIEKFKKILNQDITIFKGFDTSHVGLRETEQLNYLHSVDPNLKFINKLFRCPGQIGCYLSHHMLLKHIANTDDQNGYTVIFEDDVSHVKLQQELFSNYILRSWCIQNPHEPLENVQDIVPHLEIQNVIIDLNNNNIDFDIVFLGILTNNRLDIITNNTYSINKSMPLWGCHAMIIKNKNILKLCENNYNIINAIDDHYKTLIDEGKLIGYIVHPPIFMQNRNLSTTIGGY